MMLNSDIELIEGRPIVYIKSLSALVCSDLHLGYEDMMAAKGIFIPHVNLKNILEQLCYAIEILKPKLLIINGDIKNEFSSTKTHEFNELFDFFKNIKKNNIKIILIKGNHDNYINRYKHQFNIEIYENEFISGKYLFFHGEFMPIGNINEVDFLIVGHEHPSIKITNDNGRIERLKCFLYSKYHNKKLLVLPAISYFALGTIINDPKSIDFISPILNEINIDNANAIAIEYNETINFGRIELLKCVYP